MKFVLTIGATASAVKFGPYPGYTGPLEVKGDVDAYYTGDTVNVKYYVKGIEDACKTTPVGVANACGIHIHAGTTCEDAAAVGGHYFDATSITADPWAPISYIAGNYTSAHGSFDVKIGKEQNILGRAMVVHDSAGARVACALLPATLFTPHHEVRFGAYPGYTGALKVTGEVGAYYRTDTVGVHFNIQGVERDACKTTPVGVANACGIHIHAGKTCEDAASVGGHYFDTTSITADPWSTITYSATRYGTASDYVHVVVGKEQDISGRAMVVHDSTGARVACAQLPVALFAPQHGVKFGSYPGYAGALKVTGEVGAYYLGDTVGVNFQIHGVEADACKAAPVGVANACGIHIHAGTTCEDAAAVGGHYFDATSITADPWSPITYIASRYGSAVGYVKVAIGKGQDISGRAMVVHDSTGARVACALLPAGFFTV